MARQNNFHILLINTEEDAESEFEAIKLLLGRQVDGLIIMPVYDSAKNRELYESLPVPFIFAGRRIKGMANHSVLHGDAEGGKEVFRYLIEAGHKRILYLAGPPSVSNAVDRKKGAMEAFQESGMSLDENYIIETTGHIDDGYTAANQALNNDLDFTAIACFNDLLAMGVLKSLFENDLKVPSDIEVFGYDNLKMAQYMQPRLSSVDVPKAKLGQIAMEELMSHIENKGKKVHYHKYETQTYFQGVNKEVNVHDSRRLRSSWTAYIFFGGNYE